MSIQSQTPPRPTGYLLLFRSTNWSEDISGNEIRDVMDRVNAWFEGLSATGKLVAAQPLLEDAVVVSGKGGRSVIDGPFAEAKEAVGGYVLLSVDSMEEAVEIAKSNPMNDYGVITEVRVTADNCPHIFQALTRLAEMAT